jgi:hypothetical protein
MVVVGASLELGDVKAAQEGAASGSGAANLLQGILQQQERTEAEQAAHAHSAGGKPKLEDATEKLKGAGSVAGVDSSRHFSYYAYEGATGAYLWSHTSTAFKKDLEEDADELQPQHNFRWGCEGVCGGCGSVAVCVEGGVVGFFLGGGGGRAKEEGRESKRACTGGRVREALQYVLVLCPTPAVSYVCLDSTPVAPAVASLGRLDAEKLNERHYSETSCRDFRRSVLAALPHMWADRRDTRLVEAVFVRHKEGVGQQREALAARAAHKASLASGEGRGGRAEGVCGETCIERGTGPALLASGEGLQGVMRSEAVWVACLFGQNGQAPAVIGTWMMHGVPACVILTMWVAPPLCGG